MSVDLADYGWTPRLDAAFAAHAAAGREPGRVALEHTHIYRVVTRHGETLARVSGRLRHQAAARAEFPAVGDWVVLERPPAGGDARILAVLPRISRFSRRAAGDPTEEQVVASNVDVVLLVSGLDRDFNPRRIERYVVLASDSGARPVIVLNKADLVEDAALYVAEAARVAPGVDVHAVSVRRPGTLDALRREITVGRTAALLGSSGVGKSTIANALLGEERLRTSAVRAQDSRGRHTSTAREMVLLRSGGVLIDTPGMRELQLWDPGDAFGTAFADIDALASGCRFRDCRHAGEPGCAVRAAADEGRLPVERLDNYHALQRERASHDRQQGQRAALDEKRRLKTLTKALEKKLRSRDR